MKNENPHKNGSRQVLKKRGSKLGAEPGTLIHIGEAAAAPHLSILRYSAETVEEKVLTDAAEARRLLRDDSLLWVRLDGLSRDAVAAVGAAFDLHPLLLEDVLNTDHRPKLEDYDDVIFLIVKTLDFDPERHLVRARQVSIVLGRNYVITFSEEPGDLFADVRSRILSGQARARRMGSDYLAYRLIDTVVDHYFALLEQIGDHIENLEDRLLLRPDQRLLQRVHRERRELILLRRSVWPLREVIGGLQRDDTGLVTPAVQVFLRDLYDHTVQVVDTVETYRDLVTGMLDLYLSSQSNRMNEIMKVLTIMSTIFIPLTFIVGVYGTNFDVLPELHWRWGYAMMWVVMIVVAVAMLFFFRRKGWIGEKNGNGDGNGF